MPRPPIIDPATIDTSTTQYGIEAIRKLNRQRHEMEQLTAIVSVDIEKRLIIAYKDVTQDEFWVRGHIPGRPLFPGVLMIETAAQLVSYFVIEQHLMAGDFLGFGGLENVRFRSPVHPGCRLFLVGKTVKINRRQTTFNVQGFVGATMVFEGDILGVPLQRKVEA